MSFRHEGHCWTWHAWAKPLAKASPDAFWMAMPTSGVRRGLHLLDAGPMECDGYESKTGIKR